MSPLLNPLLPASEGLEVALSRIDLPAPAEPVDFFEAIQDRSYPWFLDSALDGSARGRFSFLGSDPYLVLRALGERLEVTCERAVRPDWSPGSFSPRQDPFSAIRSLLPRQDDSERFGEFPFVGGAVGYLGYELAQQTEGVRLSAADDLGLPDMVLLFVDRVLAFDHEKGMACVFGLGFGYDRAEAEARADVCAEEFSGILRAREEDGNPVRRAAAKHGEHARGCILDAPVPPDLHLCFDEERYSHAVRSILGEIAEGNVYQADLTHRMDIPFDGDAWSLYRDLRVLNPAPFGAFLDLPEATILSSSPERFLKADPDGRLESCPIKGTRPRGISAQEDEAMASALCDSPKERAENLMIVDLVRNDLGRVCETGSIEVPELMALESYAGVFQLVSRVTGRMRGDCDIVDALRASFPPGSMTGAPKIAAIELLDRLETVRRGVYSGAIGYFDCRGGADLSVVIRTLLLRDGRAYVHAGGGIVADSEPSAEYRETFDKARALFAAVGWSRNSSRAC